MEATVFNPAQQHVLHMMSYIKTTEGLDDLKHVLHEYYAQKVQQEADRLWDDGVLNQESIDVMKHEHLRTPYK